MNVSGHEIRLGQTYKIDLTQFDCKVPVWWWISISHHEPIVVLDIDFKALRSWSTSTYVILLSTGKTMTISESYIASL